MFGNEGNDQLYGGPLASRLHGGPGDDKLYAEYGLGSLLEGADGDDLIVGAGAGDATFSVTTVSGDIIRGGAGNDIIRGLGGADDIDGGSDQDRIAGGEDDDTIYEDADDILIGAPDLILTRPASVTEASLGQGNSKDQAAWSQLDGSATGDGISQVGGREQTVLQVGSLTYVAWVDDRNGNNEVFIAVGDGSGKWQEINGSASGGGVSQSDGDSREPALLSYRGVLLVAWTETTDKGSTVEIGAINGQGINLGTFPDTATARDVRLGLSLNGFSVSWIEEGQVTGLEQVHVARYTDNGVDPPTWSPAFNVTQAVSPGTEVIDHDFATVENQAVSVWSTDASSGRIVEVARFLNAWDLVRTFEDDTNNRPTVAARLHETFGTNESSIDVVVAMERTSAVDHQVVGYFGQGSVNGSSLTWSEIKPQFFADTAPGDTTSLSDPIGYGAKPELSSGLVAFHLAWVDDNFLADADGQSDIYVMGSSLGTIFHERIDGDASGTGISSTGGSPRHLSLSQSGDVPSIAWTDTAPGQSQVYLRQDEAADALLNVPDSEVAGHPTTITGGLDLISADDDRIITQVIIDWGDGTPLTTTADIDEANFESSHVYADLGSYEINVRLIDTHGGVSIADGEIEIVPFKIDI